MKQLAPIVLALVAVLVGPILLRPKSDTLPRKGERTLVIVTPHNEAIRSEFGHAFEAYYLATTGTPVHVDWRTPGGTSEIGRYVASEYLAAFENYWTHTLHKPWSAGVAASFDSPRVQPGDDTPERQARKAFLESGVSCKIDLFFGGGAFDFQQQARAGRLVDCGFVKEHPELFNDRVIPQTVSGEPFWDAQGRWIGNVVSSFGICYNSDSLQRLGISTPPTRWADLADPRYQHQIALANPTQSSSVNKAFEMLIQQQMIETLAGRPQTPGQDAAHIHEGWARAMRLLMKIGANARYFTDSSTKIALDVEAGESAAGMTIDFYGRFQSEAVRKPDGTSRIQYVNAAGGTSVGVDPIGMFRGAPNPDVAHAFISFVLSPKGQKLWNWKVGAPEGPRRYALRRLPILPELYAQEFKALRSDPDVDPYALAKEFTYHEAWTGPLFRQIAFTFRVMCIDTHDELSDAWQRMGAAGFPADAMARFQNVDAVDHAVATGRMKDALSGDKIKEVQLAKELADHFRQQYRQAAKIADSHN